MIIPTIFLDTNILWRDYLSYLDSDRNYVNRWYFGSSKIVTFTKCIYEVWGLGKNVTHKEIWFFEVLCGQHVIRKFT